MARLITSVHVADESGVSHVFGPSDAIPSWAAARITNPAAWDGPLPEPELSEPVVVETEATTESETVTEQVAPESETAPVSDVEPVAAPEFENTPAPEAEPKLDLATEPAPETVAPKRRGRPAKVATDN